MAFDRDKFIKKMVNYVGAIGGIRSGSKEKTPYSAPARGKQISKRKKKQQDTMNELFKNQ